MKCLLVLAIVGYATASDNYAVSKHTTTTYSYHGQYRGKCQNDGIYYNDASSFVMCSNGNSYKQPCAPGSRNGAYGSYQHGHTYGFQDFCGVNLVDHGYAARHSGYGPDSYHGDNYGHHGYGYGHHGNHYGHAGSYYGHQGRHYGHSNYGYEHPVPSHGYGPAHPHGYHGPSHGRVYQETRYVSHGSHGPHGPHGPHAPH